MRWLFWPRALTGASPRKADRLWLGLPPPLRPPEAHWTMRLFTRGSTKGSKEENNSSHGIIRHDETGLAQYRVRTRDYQTKNTGKRSR